LIRRVITTLGEMQTTRRLEPSLGSIPNTLTYGVDEGNKIDSLWELMKEIR
jgi:hypothetical protein